MQKAQVVLSGIAALFAALAVTASSSAAPIILSAGGTAQTEGNAGSDSFSESDSFSGINGSVSASDSAFEPPSAQSSGAASSMLSGVANGFSGGGSAFASAQAISLSDPASADADSLGSLQVEFELLSPHEVSLTGEIAEGGNGGNAYVELDGVFTADATGVFGFSGLLPAGIYMLQASAGAFAQVMDATNEGDQQQSQFDFNFEATEPQSAPIPEPASLAIWSLVGVGILVSRRRLLRARKRAM